MTSPQEVQQNTHFKTVAIIGLGLIGGSLAKLIRHKLPETTLYALDRADVLEVAQFEGTIHYGLMDQSDPELQEADLIIMGTHLNQSFEILNQLVQSPAMAPLRLMDLGSTKATICALADSLPQEFDFIGGHPLAGREIGGYANSIPDLFLGKRFLLTSCTKTSPKFQLEIAQWLQQLGMIPTLVDSRRHDRLMGLVSHFPQFYAIALANLLQKNRPEEALQFLGGGLDDQMRLMGSPYEMWRDIFQDNREECDTVLSEFIDTLCQMKQALMEDNLAPWFEGSQKIYQLYQSQKSLHSEKSSKIGS